MFSYGMYLVMVAPIPDIRGDLKISDQNNWGDLNKKLNLGGELNLSGDPKF